MTPAEDQRASTIKFSYFMAGLAAAALALSVQTYTPPSPWWLKLGYVISWGLYLVSLAASIQRLTLNLDILRIEALNEQQQSQARDLEQATLSGVTPFKTSKEAWTGAEIQEVLEHSQRIQEVFDKTFKERNQEFIRAFNLGNWCFAIGAGVHALTKVVSL